jgi:flavin reductase
MAHLGAAASIVTSDGPGGRVGISATAVCSVTDSPPTLLVCLNRSSSVYPVVIRNAVFCINTLGPGHQELATIFGGKTPQDMRFAKAAWSLLATGSPVLEDALVSLDCRIVDAVQRGSHDVLFATVEGITQHPKSQDGLIYFGRALHTVSNFRRDEAAV